MFTKQCKNYLITPQTNENLFACFAELLQGQTHIKIEIIFSRTTCWCNDIGEEHSDGNTEDHWELEKTSKFYSRVCTHVYVLGHKEPSYRKTL